MIGGFKRGGAPKFDKGLLMTVMAGDDDVTNPWVECSSPFLIYFLVAFLRTIHIHPAVAVVPYF